jgi:hypothetical protein
MYDPELDETPTNITFPLPDTATDVPKFITLGSNVAFADVVAIDDDHALPDDFVNINALCVDAIPPLPPVATRTVFPSFDTATGQVKLGAPEFVMSVVVGEDVQLLPEDFVKIYALLVVLVPATIVFPSLIANVSPKPVSDFDITMGEVVKALLPFTGHELPDDFA